MNRRALFTSIVAVLLAVSAVPALAISLSPFDPLADRITLAVTMTNDASANQIQVYDASTLNLLQSLPANGAGGAGGNARGVRQYNGKLVAVVN
ncbi:MAG TPA: hypothetical protein VFC24_06085, partial [Casimicrobiaceae bacterium]|nr:hypothetical protein [Casimicrobiaceae bacterium]